MKFATTFLTVLGSAAVAKAATLTFWTLDDKTRTILFTSNEDKFSVPSVTVSNAKKTVVTMPESFVGNFIAVPEGSDAHEGMLGEVIFGGWNGLTYFDVSAIVKPDDTDNVKQMWPNKALGPVSGCENFPCNTAYYLPDDVQTRATDETDLTVTLGQGSTPVALNFNLNI